MISDLDRIAQVCRDENLDRDRSDRSGRFDDDEGVARKHTLPDALLRPALKIQVNEVVQVQPVHTSFLTGEFAGIDDPSAAR